MSELHDELDRTIAELRRLETANAGLLARFTAPIVCMCGSTKFKQAWIAENARLTGEGNIVLSVGLWGHHERKYPELEVKAMLDDLHKRKIDLCDWVWVLDVGGYIGESTRSEIDYAMSKGKLIRFLSLEFPEYVEPVDELLEIIEELTQQRDFMRNLSQETGAKNDTLENQCIAYRDAFVRIREAYSEAGTKCDWKGLDKHVSYMHQFGEIATYALKIIPAAPAHSAVSYWWCGNCKVEVDAKNVTYQEHHDSCGHPVELVTIPGTSQVSGDDYFDRTEKQL